jgi:hypothetical protein
MPKSTVCDVTYKKLHLRGYKLQLVHHMNIKSLDVLTRAVLFHWCWECVTELMTASQIRALDTVLLHRTI